MQNGPLFCSAKVAALAVVAANPCSAMHFGNGSAASPLLTT